MPYACKYVFFVVPPEEVGDYFWLVERMHVYYLIRRSLAFRDCMRNFLIKESFIFPIVLPLKIYFFSDVPF